MGKLDVCRDCVFFEPDNKNPATARGWCSNRNYPGRERRHYGYGTCTKHHPILECRKVLAMEESNALVREQSQKENKKMSDIETQESNKEGSTMEKITQALATTNKSTVDNVKTGIKQGAAVKAEKVIMEQMKRLVGDSFPADFYATSLGEFVMDVGACYLAALAAEVLPQIPAAGAVKEYAGHAVVGVTAKATEPLLQTAEQLITGIAGQAALTDGK